MQPAVRTIKIHSHRHTHTKATFACVRACVCVYILLLSFAKREATLFGYYSRSRVLGHNLFSIGHRFLYLHFHVRIVWGFLAFAIANLYNVFHPQQQHKQNTVSICLCLYALLRFASAIVSSFRVCTLYLLLHATEKKVAFLLLCVALRWAVVFCLLSRI